MHRLSTGREGPFTASLAGSPPFQVLRDPADMLDMLIVATALHHAAPLATSYGRIEASGLVQVVT
jgi:hypothetical protein